MLLGTPEQSPEDHLRRLARIARIFQDKPLLQRIRSAQTYDEILSEQTPGS
jgi:mannitol/fructose-specific phosphotransferase system IIA component (Ntr-type)